MPMKTIYREGRYFPSILCDHCGETVDEGHKGHALWVESGEETVAQAEVFFVHQGCDQAFERERGTRFAWEPLEVFLHRILLNTGFRQEKAKEHAEMLSAL